MNGAVGIGRCPSARRAAPPPELDCRLYSLTMTLASKILGPLATLSLSAIVFSGVSPASAEPIDLTPTSTLDWNEGQTTAVQFDPSGRLWVWNTGYSPDLPYGFQVNVFVEDREGAWSRSYRWKPRGFFPSIINFASDGTMYATDGCKLGVVTFKPTGAVKKLKKVSFKRSFCPRSATPIDDNKVVLVSSKQAREYQLPIKSNARPLRTITFEEEYDYHSKILVADDGTVYRSHDSLISDGVDVYTPSQEGTVGPDNSFTIHPDLGTWYITGMSLGFDGFIYLRVNGDILVYETSTTGSDQMPWAEWNLGEDPSRASYGLSFDGASTFATVDFTTRPSVKFYTIVD